MIHVQLTKFRKPSVLAEGFLFLLLISIFSCATNQNISDSSNQLETGQKSYLPAGQTASSESKIKWQKIPGTEWAEYFFFENKDYPLRYHCVKIDLSNEKLAIKTFPNSENDFVHKDGLKTAFFKGLTAKEFSEKSESIISINATPYGGKSKNSKISLLTSSRKIIGIHVADRKVLSPSVSRYSAICFKKTEKGFKGEILKNQTARDFSEYDFAFGGFFTVLKDSKKEVFQVQSDDSRTAIGLSRDGKTLFLLSVEGEKHSESIGLSYQKCADVMLFLGACDAIQMDGGGSTSLYINGRNSLSYTNSRKNAVFIGFSNR